jgi:hypothetical protein
VGFPGVAQAARLTRCLDSDRHPAPGIQTEWLMTSRPADSLSAQQMLTADRRYWAIETGLHLRLDVSAGEDRSRVRHPVSALNLAMIRRAVVSLAVHWIQRGRNPRQATLSGFFDSMAAHHSRKAFSLVIASYPSWLPP